MRAMHDNRSDNITRVFSKLVFEGKIHAALRYLSENHGGGVLNIHEHVNDSDGTVLDILRKKHPASREVRTEALLTTTCDPPEVHPVLFEQLTGQTVRNAALRTKGSAGLSGIDVTGWCRICAAFHRKSSYLCTAFALVGRRLCSDFVAPAAAPLLAFLACRLIPLDKNPGVRLTGVCEVIRRILGKAVMEVVC